MEAMTCNEDSRIDGVKKEMCKPDQVAGKSGLTIILLT